MPFDFLLSSTSSACIIFVVLIFLTTKNVMNRRLSCGRARHFRRICLFLADLVVWARECGLVGVSWKSGLGWRSSEGNHFKTYFTKI